MTGNSSASTYRVNDPAVVYQAFTGEVVLINLETGNYYSLSKAGADVWSLIVTGTNTADLEERIVRQHIGEPAAIRGAVGQFLQTLADEKLIVPNEAVEAPAAANPASPSAAAERVPLDGLELQKYSDMQELLALDPVHDVDEFGWPGRPPSLDRPSNE
jgi:hypothetical protein